MAEKVFIYSLNCPFTGHVRYVGKTKGDLLACLKSHIDCPFGKRDMCLWLESLSQRKIKPTIHLLEVSDNNSFEKRLSYWTMHFMQDGLDLFNDAKDLEYRESEMMAYLCELENLGIKGKPKRLAIGCFGRFLDSFSGQHPARITHKHIHEYIQGLVSERGISVEHEHDIIQSINIYFHNVLRRKIRPLEIKRRKNGLGAYPTMTQSQISEFMNSISNVKQKAVFGLMYYCGIKMDRVISINKSDVDIGRGVVSVQGVMIDVPENIRVLLEEYTHRYKPSKYMFASQSGGGHYSEAAIKVVFRDRMVALGFDSHNSPDILSDSRLSHISKSASFSTRIEGDHNRITASGMDWKSFSPWKRLEGQPDRGFCEGTPNYKMKK